MKKLITPLLVALLVLANALQLSAQNLRPIAQNKGVYIGNIISNAHLNNPSGFDGSQGNDILDDNFNYVVLENAMKMNAMLPGSEPANIHSLSVTQLKNTLNASNITDFISIANGNSNQRTRGHAMIWFSQAPDWLEDNAPNWTAQQVFDFSRKYILALGEIAGNNIDEWDVLNEAINTSSSGWRNGNNIWYRKVNDQSTTTFGPATYENYFKMLFVWAREAQPNARLYYNDFSIENFSTSSSSKNRFMREQMVALKNAGAPIDGVGFQSHFILDQMVNISNGQLNQSFIDQVEATMDDLGANGLEVAITELDIRICDLNGDWFDQKVAYQAMVEMALEQPNCRQLLIWGMRDENNWVETTNLFPNCEDAALYHQSNYTAKPSLDGVRDALSSLSNASFPPSFPPLNQGGGGNSINSVSGPASVSPGGTASVSVGYSSTGNHDVQAIFQLSQAPYTTYGSQKIDVSAGSGTLNFSIPIAANTPIANNAYQYQVFITPNNGDWNNRFDNQEQGNISATNALSDEINSVSNPASVQQGSTASVSVSYSASTNRDIVILFQLDTSPWTQYGSTTTAVSAGSGTINVNVSIPGNTPIANNAYQFQTFIAPTGGNWGNRLDNLTKNNIDVIGGGGGIANGIYYIKKASSNAYINAPANTNNLNNVSSPSGNSSKWSFTSLGNDEYSISNVAFSGQRMEVPFGATGNGSVVARTTFTGNADHLIWIAVPVGSNYQFLPKHDQARALDIWQNAPNTVHLWGANTNNANQVFSLIPTSARLADSQPGLSVYPNPARDVLIVDGLAKGQTSLSVYDPLGQLVKEIYVDGSANRKAKLSIAELPAGMYFIRATGQAQTLSTRFIKQ
ncbi:MAG: endo-1,4-beta-xylanase [Bacteroidota bacterium]